MLNQHKPSEGWPRQSAHLDGNGQNAVSMIDSAYLMCISTKVAVRLQYSRVIPASFLQVTVCVLYVTVPSHTINLLVIFMSLSILKGCSSCKCSRCPSEISLRTEEGHSDMPEGKAFPRRELLHNLCDAYLCPFCSVCICVACAKWQFADKIVCCY